MEDRKAVKRTIWKPEEEMLLLQLWEKNVHDLRKSKRNFHIYSKIAEAFRGKTGEEIHHKINNFTQRYRKEKKTMGASDGCPVIWKYYPKIHKILGKVLAPDRELLEESVTFTIKSESVSIDSSCEDVTNDEITTADHISTCLPEISSHLPASSAAFEITTDPPETYALFRMPESPGTSTPDNGRQSPLESRPKKSKMDSVTIQRHALNISKKNSEIFQRQCNFTQASVNKQLKILEQSVQLLRENTENSKMFSKKIIEISERQQEMEKDFFHFFKKYVREE